MTGATTQASSIEIRDCSVLDTDNGTFVPHRTLVIVGGKITRIGEASGQADLPGDSTREHETAALEPRQRATARA